jgi:hypothetical protein
MFCILVVHFDLDKRASARVRMATQLSAVPTELHAWNYVVVVWC